MGGGAKRDHGLHVFEALLHVRWKTRFKEDRIGTILGVDEWVVAINLLKSIDTFRPDLLVTRTTVER